MSVYIADVASGVVVVNSSSYTVGEELSLLDTTVNRGTLYVSSGGTTTQTTVDWGSMFVSSGGTATQTTVNRYGSMFISSGGTALEIVENGGYVEVADGAEVTFLPNTISGVRSLHVTVHSGTTVLGGGGMHTLKFSAAARQPTSRRGSWVLLLLRTPTSQGT